MMMRRCDGQDPALIRPLVHKDEVTEAEYMRCIPCDCGKVFDDVLYQLHYPHNPIGT